jgi:hypothetical protein
MDSAVWKHGSQVRRPRRGPPTAARPRPRKPGGNRSTRSPRSTARARGLPWFAPEQWAQLRDVSEDRGELATSYETWLAENQRAYDGLATCGVNIKKVVVDVNALTAWCRANKLRVDANSRPAFVTYLLNSGSAELVD